MPRAGSSFRGPHTSSQHTQKSRREQDEADDEDGTDGGSEDEDAPADEEDAEGEVDSDVTRDNGDFRASKRARLNEDGDARQSDKGREKEKEVVVRTRVKTLPRDVDGYIPGSIVRIQLKNFVTYDFVEFRPGPYLNMILGPNGTGKSSIACAICLGLNWSPSVLGRASDLNSFVKHGAKEGHIEIELKGPKGRGNLVIRRCLRATAKSSLFFLNDKSSSGKEITAKMAELNVQVGNLCSFLPQDKVSEFAQMTPQQLLKETQRAAGDERLSAWHETLIDAGHELKKLSDSIGEDKNQLGTMRQRNEGIERDVQRFKDREKIQYNIQLLHILIPVEHYQMLRIQFMEAKSKQRKLHAKVKKLKEKNEPAHDLLKKLENDLKTHEKTRDRIKKTTLDRFVELKRKWTDSEKLEQQAEDYILNLQNLKKEEKERVRKMKKLEQEIASTEEEIVQRSEVKLEKAEDLQAEMRQLQAEREEVVVRKAGVDERIRQNVENMAYAKTRLEQAQTELKKLDDVNVRKLQALRQWDQATHDAVVWLRCNRNLFKMEVFEPPILCLTVPNKDFVRAIEGCFGGTQIRTFVAQCQEDLDTFNYYVNDSDKALGRKVRVTTWFRSGWDHNLLPPPMSRDEMHMLGFDGFAIDYVECPQGLHSFLLRELNFHRTAVARDPRRVDVGRAMEAVANPETGGGANFICGTTMNIVSRSRYGEKAVSNLTREIGPVRNLGNSSIDPEVKNKIDAQIAESRQSMAVANEEKMKLDEELKGIQEDDKVFQDRAALIKKRKDKIKKFEEEKVKLEVKLNKYKANLTSLRDHPSSAEERAKLKKSLLRISHKRIKIAKEYTNLGQLIKEEHTEATRMAIKYLQASANKAALETLCEEKAAKYTAALAEFEKADREFQEVKAESKSILDKTRELVDDASSEMRTEFHAIQTARLEYEGKLKAAKETGTTPPDSEGVELRSLNELQAELEKQETDLELNMSTDKSVVDQYERRKAEMEMLEKKIADKERKAEKIERDIKSAKDKWKPALEKLVASIGEKFSLAFDRFGCAGEIRISEHEDYAKWAIDILVKFRDTEKLQILTAQRQSGGERSLTTILYLLSLTEEARAPFSLVDEINQGMDQRAERTVHNSMVEVTCNVDSAQYFLITPKLLPDLEYHDRMKILCVNNGEWLPEDPAVGNMMAMINGFVQHRRLGQAVNSQ